LSVEQYGRMADWIFIFIAAVFLLAGVVKGAIGLGLPTISMGLLAVVIPPIEAAAILILPSLLTAVWQVLAGPSSRLGAGSYRRRHHGLRRR
jgi:uncharacterized protein